MDKFWQSFTELSPAMQTGLYIVSFPVFVCTVHAIISFVDWLFSKLIPRNEKPETDVPRAWNICVVYPFKSYEEVVVLPDTVDPASVANNESYVIEGPFDDLDKAIARKDELKKKL